MRRKTGTFAQREELILAVTRVLESTKACSDQGDHKMFALLAQYYAVMAGEAAKAGGQFVKCMGDGALLTFPSGNPQAAVKTLKAMQTKANRLWQEFDQRCRVQVKVGIGTVISGMLGAPGEERLDIIGDALNSLFKAPWSNFEITPKLATRLR